MKRIYITGLIILFIINFAKGQTITKEYQMNIDTSQYYIEADTNGFALILGPDFCLDNPHLPCLPYLSIRILLPYGKVIDTCQLVLNQLQVWKKDIIVGTNPMPYITSPFSFEQSSTSIIDSSGNINYPDSVYPLNNITYNTMNEASYPVAFMEICPFVYNVKLKTVSAPSSLTLQIRYKDSPTLDPPHITPGSISYIKDFVFNPEETDSYLIAGENAERGFSSLNVHAISNNGEVTFQLSDSYDIPFQLELFTIDGTKKKAIEINLGETEKTITGLKPGCYLFGLSGKNGERINGKFTIN